MHIPITDFASTKKKVLNWVQQFNTFCFLDNHQYPSPSHTMECLLAAGAKRKLKANAGNALSQLESFIQAGKSWLFGHLSYDLKNEMEGFSSAHPDGIGFPDLFFFEPEIIIRLNEKEIIIEGNDPEKVWTAIQESVPGIFSASLINVQSRIPKEEYCAIINRLKQHILRGDCYEINFCQEFFATDAQIDPFLVFERLSTISPNPFSALYRLEDRWLICASPERFLKKQENKILSQPMKGTSKRIINNAQEDELSRSGLQHSSKDRSENVMVVDLVRNDLAKICEEGTVEVEELYGVYSFPQVHQMVSTITGQLKKDCTFTDIIRATFPMGSMTGAPKKRVMELIEQYEKTRRGIFSGATGYISPEGDFDFNVVIRSILYNAQDHYLSFPAGSGITFYSEAEKEWDECLLKAEAIRKVLLG